MIIKDYARYDALGLAELVRRREVSPEDLVDSAVDVIERLNPRLNCVVQTLRDQALAEIKAGLAPGPFHGVPFLVKEFGMHFAGMIASAGSRLAEGMRYEHDTALMSRCRAAGLVPIGTTTTPEMAFNANTEAKLHGSTRNPWNLDYSVGGSSGGAGAAVASGMVPVAHANDGGGSIRIPAACNGLVGMKPSRGRTPLGPDFGMLLWGLAVEFVETRSVRDSAALLDVLAQPDSGYFYAAQRPRQGFLAAAMGPPRKLRIAVADRFPGAMPTMAENLERLADTVKLLEGLGHVCETIRMDYDADAFIDSTCKLWATTLGHFIEQFAQATGREISLETLESVTLATYEYGRDLKAFELEDAMAKQNQVTRSACAAMDGYDVVLTPGLARDVARLGELNQDAPDLDLRGWCDQIFQQYSAFTPLFNTTGQPAVMLPLWQAKSGLPLAMQFVGHSGDEETLYNLAGQLEQAQPWAQRRPPNFG